MALAGDIDIALSTDNHAITFCFHRKLNRFCAMHHNFSVLLAGILLSIAEVFYSNYQATQGQILKVTETKFDRRRSKAHANIHPLNLKRTLSSSSRTKSVSDSKRLSNSFIPITNLSVDHKKEDNERTSLYREIPTIQLDSSTEHLKDNDTRYSPQPPTSHSKKLALKKSVSDNSLHQHPNESNESEPDRENKLDSFFRRTKTAIGNVGPRLRDIGGSSREENKKSDTSQYSSMKTRFLRLNEGIINKANEVKNPLKMIPDFRNKIQTALASPRSRKKTRALTEEEINRRNNCRTKIIEL